MAKDELLVKLADLSEAPADRAMRSQKAILMAKILDGKPYVLRKEAGFVNPLSVAKIKVPATVRTMTAKLTKKFSKPANLVTPKHVRPTIRYNPEAFSRIDHPR